MVIFKRKLEDKLNQQINEYKHFQQIFLEILNIHAPIKKKQLRANHVPYMTKALRKAIMKRSELESKYVKNKTNENLKAYKKQRNFCSKLYKKEIINLDNKKMELLKTFLLAVSRNYQIYVALF